MSGYKPNGLHWPVMSAAVLVFGFIANFVPGWQIAGGLVFSFAAVAAIQTPWQPVRLTLSILAIVGIFASSLLAWSGETALPSTIAIITFFSLALVAICWINQWIHRTSDVADEAYHDLYENAPDSYVSVDVKRQQIVHCNQALVQLLGYDKSEIIGRSPFELMEPSTIDAAKKTFASFLETGRVVDGEFLLQAKDGTCIPVSINSSSIVDRNGDIVRSRCVWRDAREKYEAEKQLRITQLTVDRNTDAVFWHRESKIVYVNDRACESLGYTREELEQLTLDDIDPFLPAEKKQQIMAEILSEGFSQFETRNLRKDGTLFPVELSVTAHEIDGDTLFCGVARDITLRKEIERRLQFTQIAVDQSMDAVFCHDLDGNISYVNDAACSKLGYTHDELLSLTIADIDRVVQKSGIRGPMDRLQKERTLSLESVHFNKAGEEFPVEVRITLFEFDEQKYVMAVAHDITERKTAEQSLAISVDRFQLLAKATNDGIWDWDLTNNHVWWNEEYDKQFGPRPIDTATTWGWWPDRVHPDDLERAENSFRAAIDGDSNTWVCQYRFKRNDGEYRHILDRAYISRDRKGKAIRFLGAMQDLTEQKRIENNLREQTTILRSFLENLPVGVAVFDTEGILKLANREMANITGVDFAHGTPAEFPAKRDRYSLDGTVRFEDQLSITDRALAGEKIENEQMFVKNTRLADGKYLSCSANVLRDESDEPIGVIQVIHDISEMKKLVRALRESAEELRLITDSAPTLISFVDDQQRYQFNNLAYEKFFDIDRVQLKGKTLREINGEENYEHAKPYVERALAGEHVQFEIDLRRKKGNALMLADFVPRKDADGNVLGFYVLATDITHRKLVEEKLRKSEQRLLLAMEAGRMGTFDWNLVTHEATVSDIVYELHGYRPGEVAPEFVHFTDRVHPDDLEEALVELENCRENRLEFRHEYRVVLPDSSTQWMEIRGRHVYDDEGNAIRLFGVVIDIDQMKSVEQRLLEGEANLNRAIRLSALGELTAGIAHELNQPIAAVVNSAEFLNESARESELEAQVLKETLDLLCDSAFRASEIISRMRSLVRKSISQRDEFCINELIRESIELLRPQLRMDSVQVRLALNENLPRIRVDGIQIQQILVNLVNNAQQAMSKSKKAARLIQIETRHTENGVEVSVSDTGHGILTEDSERLFDHFSSGSGLGVGLRICRSIVESHQGKIWAENNKHGGATFCFQIPEVVQEPELV